MRLNIDARARRALRRLSWNDAVTVARIMVMAVVGVQAARLIWAVATPIDAFGPWRGGETYSAVEARALLKGFDPFFRLDVPAASGPAVVTSLQLTLFGTRIDDATGRGAAIIATADGQQKSYAVGEEVAPGVKLKAVMFDHITLDRGGSDEDLFIDQSSAAAASLGSGGGAAPFVSSPATASGGASSELTIDAIRAGVGFTPRIDNGRVTGLVVRPQSDGGIFRQVGFRENDVVVQINGQKVTGLNDFENLEEAFAKGGNISLSVERGAEILPIVINVTGK